MATGRRESMRTQAVNFAQCQNAKKFDAENFIRTGQLEEYRRGEIPATPLFLAAVERLKRWKKTGEIEERN